jgi:hypothetical protein
MFRKPIFLLVVVLALTSMACRVGVPVTRIETGPIRTEEIDVPLPDSQNSVEVELIFGAGDLNVKAGAKNALITGTARYNVDEFKPEVETSSNRVTVKQGNLSTEGIPSFQGDLKNEWDLQLGGLPLELNIKAGAYQGRYELGGLALERLTVADGAADVELGFSEPNLAEMSLLRYETGASDVTLQGLANANFDEMEFRGGAGSYTLDFTGDLRRDAEVSVEAGISSVTIIVPEGMNVELTFDGGLSNVSLSGDWEQRSGKFVQNGSGPTLTIRVKMGAGDLQLENP